MTIQLVAAYLVVMTLIAVAGRPPAWHLADWYALRALYGTPATSFSDLVILYDVKSYDKASVVPLRTTLAAFLERVAGFSAPDRPSKIVLDFWFSAGDRSPATARFLASISKANAAGIDLYAAANPPVQHTSFGTDIFDRQQVGRFAVDEAQRDERIYTVVPPGHTTFDEVDGPNILSFRKCLTYPTDFGPHSVYALAWLVSSPAEKTCRQDDSVTLLIDPSARIPAAQSHTLDAHSVILPSAVAKKIVVLGAPKYDAGDFGNMSNPEVVAWAISTMLQPANVPNIRPALLLLPIPVFGAAAAALFAYLAIFMVIARRASKNRLALPWLAAVLAGATALALFVGVEELFARLGTVQPQVTLPSISLVLASALCGMWGRAWTVNQLRLIGFQQHVAKTYDYDIFLSYAHEDYDWVMERVYEPLREAKLPGGARLQIFFDRDVNRKSIEVSDLWMDTIALSISGSRYIVPVYSDIYFLKDYCLYELRRSHRRQIESSGRWSGILPVMRGTPKIPSAFDDVQAAAADSDPLFIQHIIERILNDLARTTPA